MDKNPTRQTKQDATHRKDSFLINSYIVEKVLATTNYIKNVASIYMYSIR
jgi:hypothetical protein